MKEAYYKCNPMLKPLYDETNNGILYICIHSASTGTKHDQLPDPHVICIRLADLSTNLHITSRQVTI